MSHFTRELLLRIFGYGLPLLGSFVAQKWGAEYGAPIGVLAAWLLSQAEKGTLPRRRRLFPAEKGSEEKTEPGVRHG
jgi:hypothetical protein